MRSAIPICFAALVSACSAPDGDPFPGVFESETRENFGSGTPGEWRIEVVSSSQGKYTATLYYNDMPREVTELVPCSEDKEDYLRGRPAGRAQVLCYEDRIGGALHGFISYVENGIYVPAVRRKYIDNPALVEQEGLKPGDPGLFEVRHHRAKYYAHAEWFFYGFRKVER